MPGPITVGLDGSRESLAAAGWAAREARRRGLPLRLVHAWEGLTPVDREPDLPELAVPRHWARRILREAEGTLAQRYPDVPVLAEQIAGAPAGALLAAAKEAGMLVLGSRGLGGVAGTLVGSVALATAAHAGCPVALVRAGEVTAEEGQLQDEAGPPYADAAHGDVLLGLDPHSTCDALIEFAFDTAARRAAPLRVLHVWRPPRAYADVPVAGYELGIDAEYEAKAREDVTTALRPWRDKNPRQPVTEDVLVGRAAGRVPVAADQAALVVVGRRIRHAALGAHLGPVAHAVIHHAHCPVVVIPHD
ncbi:universal stress protein [Streptomyces purpurogeneiscleroticus]|uniref:universal stress protein n=1 Tax=Streptomyces purpurogeneiscleroticus TaxID=68259 RepID=UPI001CBE39C0|nr:universal stress protein [Streptomyces purpurogeneiscleroticus]MBZ4019642.1 hypothetical protein [Streptomyces purpurogeneiscleroticus]